ncbi:hypothetical protein ACFLXI_05540 [Chloroflexota bacterium]
MKIKAFVMLGLALLLISSPVYASSKTPVGDPISVYGSSPNEFAAGDPFHIKHGWAEESVENGPPGKYGFELYMDGERVSEDFVMRTFYPQTDPVTFDLVWVHNFPDGMIGTHTFTGHWYAPCEYAVEIGSYPGPCPQPNASVLSLERSLTVEFVE